MLPTLNLVIGMVQLETTLGVLKLATLLHCVHFSDNTKLSRSSVKVLGVVLLLVRVDAHIAG